MRYNNTAIAIAGYPRDFLDFWVNELIAARGNRSVPFYLISPWITQVEFQLGGRGYLSDIYPGQSRVLLSDVLLALIEHGVVVRIAARYPGFDQTPSDTDRATVAMIQTVWQANPDAVQVHLFSDLHTKLFVGQVSGVHGSGNATYQGTYINKELLTYVSSPTDVSRLRDEAYAVFSSRRNRVPEQPILEG
jgi:hypothetical protein